MENGDFVGLLFGGCFWIVYMLIFVMYIAGMWKVYTKANKPGWAAIIPIYNLVVLMEIAGRPGWWVLLIFVPVVNIVVLAMVSIDIATSFGKGTGFGIGLWLFGMIFYLILGFGSAQYVGPAAAQAPPMPPANPTPPAPPAPPAPPQQ